MFHRNFHMQPKQKNKNRTLEKKAGYFALHSTFPFKYLFIYLIYL